MNTRTLYLAWQDRHRSRQWFPVARLDADVARSFYRFRYIRGAKRAKGQALFPPLLEFPDMDVDYKSAELFPVFSNRVIAPRRPDRLDYLRKLDLPEDADPVEILAVNGGHRVTDHYEVFPKLEKSSDGSFTVRFFLHGWSHLNEPSRKRIDSLETGERLYVTLEVANPETRTAVQIQTLDYFMIGWAPRYLVDDLIVAITADPTEYQATVVRLNPVPSPSRQRLLIELKGKLNGHEPMSGSDYDPLVN